MPSAVKNVLACIAGFLVGSVVNMAIVTVGPMVIPPPDGVDMSNIDEFAENLKLLQPVNFIAPWLAHALGTLAGAFVAAKVAASHAMKFAIGIGVFFLLGGITVIVMFGGPVWFGFVDVVGAYLPMACLGGWLARANEQAAE